MENAQLKRMQSILLCNLIVGHTHDKVDRFFSRIRAILKGIDYFTWGQVQELVMKKMRGFTVQMEHLTTAWNWKELDELQLSPLVGQRNVHCLNIFRHDGGIWIKWKQYMTSDSWSTPLLYVRPADVVRIASFRPTQKPLAFSADIKVKMHTWVHKLAVFLTDPHDTISRHHDDLSWLHQVIDGTCQDSSLRTGVDIDTIINDLRRHADQDPTSATFEHERLRSADVMPPEQIVTLFPGADIPDYPPDALVHVHGLSTAPPMSNLVGPGSMVICRCNADSTCFGKKMLFLLGMVLPSHNDNAHADPDVLVEWWLPSMSKESSTAPGKKKRVIDIFGSWHAFSTFPVVDLRDTQLPPVLVPRGDMLIANIVLEQNESIPYTVFDRLIKDHGIDVTGLSVCNTQSGGVYRSYVLMRLNRAADAD